LAIRERGPSVVPRLRSEPQKPGIPGATWDGCMADFEHLLTEHNVELFKAIPTQLWQLDRRSLLKIQEAIREWRGEYCYLEIGSHLGGSIQPHLLDPRCRRIYSIDKRPTTQPDERGPVFLYPDNSTARMMELLQAISAQGVAKIVTIDDDCSNINPDSIDDKPDLCLVDGEHTNQAVVRDFRFCRSVLKPDGVICFHDASVVRRGLKSIVHDLDRSGVRFRYYYLPLDILVLELGACPIHAYSALSAFANWPRATRQLLRTCRILQALLRRAPMYGRVRKWLRL
jgi:hypothetical protein